ncbi:PREDICTED: uncharacterized protein LOC104816351 isoform X2 [Tarenaya hassleriana]|uniref:uncharacterized protein LOC104816351 isoform X2 n=1 Tax=Tarenaya hassleriana TaxID=28532 RepID=UPI00053C2E1B|nr:PREDICTED: uncharacterized protein LOC104816351 isoform X2 [Tarenaya hassleriana]
MATSFRIPVFLPISPSHCRKPFFFYHHHEQQLCASEWSLRKRNRSICFACAVKQTRVRKKVKSNEELRGEIMEFIALVGFPEDHVPSIKELLDHGRNDLANIVRRRGYKFIRELLANSKMENNKEFASDETANFGPSAAGVSEIDALTGQDERAQGVGEEDLSSSGFSSMGRRYSAAPDNSMYLDRDTNNSREGNFITFLSPRAEEHGSASKDGSPVVEVPGTQNSLPVFGNGIYLSLDDKSDSGDLESDRIETNEVVGDDLSSSEFPTLWNVSYVLDDTPSCSDKEADNVVAAKNDDVNDVGKDASLSSGVHPYEQHYTSPVLN